MCTVTYFKTEKGFVLTSNRDERFNRATTASLVSETIGSETVTFPRDLEAGGTWLATSATRTHCLLNGAYKKYTYNPPYRMSRGLMLLELFLVPFDEFLKTFVFEGMEPFTLVSVVDGDLHETRWDGTCLYHKSVDNSSDHIWCSATLYAPEENEKRKHIFSQLTHKHAKSVLDLHLSAAFKLDIGDKGTVSTSQVICEDGKVKMHYYPVVRNV